MQEQVENDVLLTGDEPVLHVDETKWSNEEVFFRDWLEELKDAGFVEFFDRPSEPYLLYPSVSVPYLNKKSIVKDHTLHREATYLPDFSVLFSENARGILFFDGETIVMKKKPFFYGKSLMVEVKGSFVGNNNSDISAPIKMKAIYQLYGIITVMAKVPNIFEETFYPKSFMVTPSGKPKKDRAGKVKVFKGIEDFVLECQS